ncbi:MAG TPA: caspase family protein [Trebonia sp.]|nr:caspase family protein [Trebonia sp.]
MSAPDGIDFGRSRAVLIGTSSYTEGLESMQAAANSLRRMEELLVGLCGWPSSAVTPFEDLSTGDRRLREVSKLIEEATDVLLLYYVGHGLLLPGDDLGLALTDTDANAALHLTTTYRMRTLREQLRYHCRARLKLIILDCCFAGIATRNAQGPDGLADRVDHASRIEGTYTWTAARASQQAVYEDGDGGLTYFTKVLHEVVASGIPGKPAWLTLADVDVAVAQRFQELPLPNTPIRPEQTRLAVGGMPGMFPFAPNAAFTPSASKQASPNSPPGNGRAGQAHDRRAARARAARLLDEALDIARYIGGEGKRARALIGVAQVLAATDPGRAGRLITDAERLAQTITDESGRGEALHRVVQALIPTDPDRAEHLAQQIASEAERAWALSDIAQAVVAADPDRAERLAQSITYERFRASTLESIATALAASDPDRAERLIADIRRVAESAADEDVKVWALREAVRALAAIDPDRAERLAESITSDYSREWALNYVVLALVPADPDRAERLAQSFNEDDYRVMALSSVAVAMAAADPDRAERLAQVITNSPVGKSSKAREVNRIVRALAAADPDRAERIARFMIDDADRRSALHVVAAVLAATDPDRAERLVQSYDRPLIGGLANVAVALAAADPQRAGRLARTIAGSTADAEFKAPALGRVAAALTASDPDRAERLSADAERIARSITDESEKASTLTGIASSLMHSPQ